MLPMFDWLSQFTGFSVFLGISALGFLFLLVSLVFGEIFDHLGGDSFDLHVDHGGPGFFSSRVVSVFVTAFGGFGAIGVHYGLSLLAASGLGMVSGVFFGGLIYLFARFLYQQQASTDVLSSDPVGRPARVVVAIPADGLGQIRCKMGEELVDRIARSTDGKPIPENAVVLIEQVLGETVVVRRQ